MLDGVEAWRALQQKYEKTGEAQIARLNKKFHEETMTGPMEDPDAYFSRIDDHITRLDSMGHPLDNFSITGRVKKVLSESGPHYTTLLILLGMQPNRPYEQLKVSVSGYYDEYIADKVGTNRGVALFGAGGADNGQRRCYICASTGHVMKDCPNRRGGGGGRGRGGRGRGGGGGNGRDGGGRGAGKKGEAVCWT